MHRSGTSALAGSLSNLGINFVAPDDQLQGTIANPNGYFERKFIMDFSDLVLSTQNWTWNNVDLLPLEIGKTTPHLDEARKVIEELSTAGLVGLKDPRSCLLMPFWRRALLDRLTAIVITRDPAEVAWSLHVRDGLPVTAGLALWIAYSTHLAQGIQGLFPHVVRYEDLVDHPAAELTKIAHFLQQSGMPVSIQVPNLDIAAQTIDPTLRRPTFPAWLESHPLTIEARSIRELFHQTPTGDISFNPSELCREILDFQTTTQNLLETNHQLQLSHAEVHHQRDLLQSELTQTSMKYVNVVKAHEERIDQLNTAQSDLDQALMLHMSDLEKTRSHLSQIEQSFSWKLGLFLTWPIRKLRPSNRVPRPRHSQLPEG